MRLLKSGIKWQVLIIGAILLVGLPLTACSSAAPAAEDKAGPGTANQINLAGQQPAGLLDEQRGAVEGEGMDVGDTGIRRVYVYLNYPLNSSQAAELEGMGVIVYPDSWIPPVGNHAEGFLLVDMPVDMLEELAAVDFVVRLESADKTIRY